jgi:F-type H+-transporting ATPase subunit b
VKAVVLIAALAVVTALPAWASDEEGGLDLAGQLSWPTILVSIGVFVILLIVLSKTAWRPILDGLQKREETIKGALDDAKAAHEHAKALIAEYEAKLDKAREEGQAVLEEARKDGQELRVQIEADARRRADETVARSKREVDQVFAKAWEGLVRDAADVATQAASRIIQQQLTPEGHAAIVAGVVSEVASRGGPGGPQTGGGSA